MMMLGTANENPMHTSFSLSRKKTDLKYCKSKTNSVVDKVKNIVML